LRFVRRMFVCGVWRLIGRDVCRVID
jgi:hypothetical protein